MTTKRIVCLANSRKLSGRCIAGKEILPSRRIGGWIRPVSARPSEEVSEYERQYEDGSDPQVLDVIDIPLVEASPKNYQQENWLLDAEYYWERVERIDSSQLDRLTDPDANLWVNSHSSYNGRNDRIPTSIANGLDNSLRLIKVSGMDIYVSQPGLAFNNPKRSVQGRFRYNGVEYWLRVTDPTYERRYLRLPNGNYDMEECFLTISLGEPYQGHAYKLIAAMFEAGD